MSARDLLANATPLAEVLGINRAQILAICGSMPEDVQRKYLARNDAAQREYEALLDLEAAVTSYRARLDAGEMADDDEMGWALARLDAVRSQT